MEIPKQLRKEIIETLDQSDLGKESSHGKNTLLWVLKIKPEASLALKIAALAHDIERGVPPRYHSKDFEDRVEYKRLHSERGAKILKGILLKHNLDRDIIDEVYELVRLHEIGGTEDADVLKDADSISFFDNNLDFYYNYYGLEKTIDQIDYKFERCSPRAQGYIKELDNYKRFKKEILESKDVQ